MTPTFRGRLETRLFLLLTVGVVWTLVLSPFLGSPVTDVYKATFTSLGIVTVLGLVIWEPLYHFLMQFRWEKDWPAFFGFWTAVNEGLVAFVVLDTVGPPFTTKIFLIHFVTLWLLIWVVANGPLRIFLPHWRFRGAVITDV